MTDAIIQEEEDIEARVEKLIDYEGKYSDMEKIALETMCRTARDPLFCFELAMQMQRLRTRIRNERLNRGSLK